MLAYRMGESSSPPPTRSHRSFGKDPLDGLDMKSVLLDQFDRYWTHTLRPGLAAVTDAEYLWEPFPNCLSVRKQADGSWKPDLGTPAPAGFEPLTTIAWRMEHIAQMLAQAAERQFGTRDSNPDTGETAAKALRRIDEAYGAWKSGIDALDGAGLDQPAELAEGHEPTSLAELAVQLNCELIRQSARVSFMRDMYRAKHLDRLRTRRPSSSRRRR